MCQPCYRDLRAPTNSQTWSSHHICTGNLFSLCNFSCKTAFLFILTKLLYAKWVMIRSTPQPSEGCSSCHIWFPHRCASMSPANELLDGSLLMNRHFICWIDRWQQALFSEKTIWLQNPGGSWSVRGNPWQSLTSDTQVPLRKPLVLLTVNNNKHSRICDQQMLLWQDFDAL